MIVLYDSNKVCLDGPTSDTFNEDIGLRFISQGWNVVSVEDGNSYESINKAISEASLQSGCIEEYKWLPAEYRYGTFRLLWKDSGNWYKPPRIAWCGDWRGGNKNEIQGIHRPSDSTGKADGEDG